MNTFSQTRELALMLRGFSYDGSTAAQIHAHAEHPAWNGAPDSLVLPRPENGADDAEYRRTAAAGWIEYRAENGTDPATVLVDNTAVFALSRVSPEARSGVAASRATGVASTRSSIVSGRVAVVTGGAQGFGFEIGRELALGGASVVLVDRDAGAAERAAEELNRACREGCAVAVGCDVAKEPSVARMVDAVVDACGGFDLFVSNAGVLRAGSVLELPAEEFDAVTAVNYKAFFLCTKHAARALLRQEAAYRLLNQLRAGREPNETAGYPPHFMTDIIQVNSKSGLRGSNRNGAYAGSKFGAIGLVQSFALELVEHGIKVNAVCPGNFFDGPLWSDPDNGLFVQYLRAGKVPGAGTVADVRRHYENQVPMKRGCTGADVARAVLYLVEQQYETGQALPITGGQVMLR